MTEKHHFLLFGGERDREYAGVGFVMSDKLKPAVSAAWAVSPRLCAAIIRTAPREVLVINVYIPQSPTRRKATRLRRVARAAGKRARGQGSTDNGRLQCKREKLDTRRYGKR
eukprot:9974108-Alexandrium_andersonii.AAC.1